MSQFKIWNQGNDGNTMGIRAAGVREVARIATALSAPSDDNSYPSLTAYLTVLATARRPPTPYRRAVDVLWRTAIGYGSHCYFPGRTLEVTYTGNVRQSGGFAAQCYVIVDPQGFALLGALHLVPITVAVLRGGARDLLEVTV